VFEVESFVVGDAADHSLAEVFQDVVDVQSPKFCVKLNVLTPDF
jgi:hypothetical protein